LFPMDSEISEMFRLSELCALCRCGCCKDDCPMYSEILEESISPKGRNLLIRAIRMGVVEPDERALRIAYSCLLCKRDEFSCIAAIKNADVTEAFRRFLLEKGMPMLPEHEVLVKSLENYGNPWQEPRSAKKRWAKEFQNRRLLPGRMDTLVYVGCTYAQDRTLQEGPRALARIMDKAGEEYGLMLEDEVCCGSTVKRIGNIGMFEKLRGENEKKLRQTGVKQIVTACSGCFKTIKQDYPGLGEDFELLHSTQYILKAIKANRIELDRLDTKVTYHDPCHLGRHAGVFDEPRDILGFIPGLELVEMKNSRELSRCCGGGAGVKTAYPEVSKRVAEIRVKEAEMTGAEAIVTACPFCVQTLRAAVDSTGSKLKVVALEVLVDGVARGRRGR
jgi:heterodisulfide reductase subunit D